MKNFLAKLFNCRCSNCENKQDGYQPLGRVNQPHIAPSSPVPKFTPPKPRPPRKP